ncbi:MAG: DUF721 domain-containing protein [Plesiomonas sp.]|uniref:DUF721 domain-containing protein n=1 Tax=Plesiomonas sp. TaxID=2486279 RepID=UPI003F2B1CE9
MRDHRPQPLEALFTESHLQNVQQRAIALLKLNQTVKALLPAELHPHCRVANFRQSILILEITNASFALRLRYLIPALLSELRRQTLPTLVTIEHRINPRMAISHATWQSTPSIQHYSESAERATRTISAQTAEHLHVLASHSSASAKLKEKLQKLAALAQQNTALNSKAK